MCPATLSSAQWKAQFGEGREKAFEEQECVFRTAALMLAEGKRKAKTRSNDTKQKKPSLASGQNWKILNDESRNSFLKTIPWQVLRCLVLESLTLRGRTLRSHCSSVLPSTLHELHTPFCDSHLPLSTTLWVNRSFLCNEFNDFTTCHLDPVTWESYRDLLHHSGPHTNVSTRFVCPWVFLAEPVSKKMVATPSIHVSCTYGHQFSVLLCCLVLKTLSRG